MKGYPGDILKEYIDSTVPELSVGELWDTCEYTNAVLNYNQVEPSPGTVLQECLSKIIDKGQLIGLTPRVALLLLLISP